MKASGCVFLGDARDLFRQPWAGFTREAISTRHSAAASRLPPFCNTSRTTYHIAHLVDACTRSGAGRK